MVEVQEVTQMYKEPKLHHILTQSGRAANPQRYELDMCNTSNTQSKQEDHVGDTQTQSTLPVEKKV